MPSQTCALDFAVEIAIHDVIPGAAGAAHGKGADEKQRHVPGIWIGRAGGDGSKPGRPPARHQQQPGADWAVEAGKTKIWARPGGRDRVDPIAGRISDTSDGGRHRASGLPCSVSKVPPRPVFTLEVSGMREVPSASLRLGGGGADARAALQT